MTPTKREGKTTAKKPAKRAVKKTVADGNLCDKSTLESAEVTQAGMAMLLGLTSPNINALTNTGTLTKNANGNYDLVEQVRTYVKALREKKSGASRGTLETEALQLKNEKAKTYLEGWRRTRDRMVAVAIVEALKGAMLQLKEEIARGTGVNQGIDKVISTLSTVDYEITLAEVENDDEEDEL